MQRVSELVTNLRHRLGLPHSLCLLRQCAVYWACLGLSALAILALKAYTDYDQIVGARVPLETGDSPPAPCHQHSLTLESDKYDGDNNLSFLVFWLTVLWLTVLWLTVLWLTVLWLTVLDLLTCSIWF